MIISLHLCHYMSDPKVKLIKNDWICKFHQCRWQSFCGRNSSNKQHRGHVISKTTSAIPHVLTACKISLCFFSDVTKPQQNIHCTVGFNVSVISFELSFPNNTVIFTNTRHPCSNALLWSLWNSVSYKKNKPDRLWNARHYLWNATIYSFYYNWLSEWDLMIKI